MIFYDLPHDSVPPKRGDIMQTNVGQRRERTWLILRVRWIRRAKVRETPEAILFRYQIWMARWWELEPDMRMRLFRSAERNGGQRIFPFYRYPVKRKQTFEDHMRRVDEDSRLWE